MGNQKRKEEVGFPQELFLKSSLLFRKPHLTLMTGMDMGYYRLPHATNIPRF